MYRKNNGEPKTGPCETVEQFFSRIEQPMDWVYDQVRLENGYKEFNKNCSGKGGGFCELEWRGLTATCRKARSQREAKDKAFIIMAVKIAVKNGILPNKFRNYGDDPITEGQKSATTVLDPVPGPSTSKSLKNKRKSAKKKRKTLNNKPLHVQSTTNIAQDPNSPFLPSSPGSKIKVNPQHSVAKYPNRQLIEIIPTPYPVVVTLPTSQLAVTFSQPPPTSSVPFYHPLLGAAHPPLDTAPTLPRPPPSANPHLGVAHNAPNVSLTPEGTLFIPGFSGQGAASYSKRPPLPISSHSSSKSQKFKGENNQDDLDDRTVNRIVEGLLKADSQREKTVEKTEGIQQLKRKSQALSTGNEKTRKLQRIGSKQAEKARDKELRQEALKQGKKFCVLCKGMGHSKLRCPTLETSYCEDCKVYGHTRRVNCPTWRANYLAMRELRREALKKGPLYCDHCRAKGHIQEECSKRYSNCPCKKCVAYKKYRERQSCLQCGEEGHKASNCSLDSEKYICRHCGKTGHFRKDCKEIFETVSNSSDNEYPYNDELEDVSDLEEISSSDDLDSVESFGCSDQEDSSYNNSFHAINSQNEDSSEKLHKLAKRDLKYECDNKPVITAQFGKPLNEPEVTVQFGRPLREPLETDKFSDYNRYNDIENIPRNSRRHTEFERLSSISSSDDNHIPLINRRNSNHERKHSEERGNTEDIHGKFIDDWKRNADENQEYANERRYSKANRIHTEDVRRSEESYRLPEDKYSENKRIYPENFITSQDKKRRHLEKDKRLVDSYRIHLENEEKYIEDKNRYVVGDKGYMNIDPGNSEIDQRQLLKEKRNKLREEILKLQKSEFESKSPDNEVRYNTRSPDSRLPRDHSREFNASSRRSRDHSRGGRSSSRSEDHNIDGTHSRRRSRDCSRDGISYRRSRDRSRDGISSRRRSRDCKKGSRSSRDRSGEDFYSRRPRDHYMDEMISAERPRDHYRDDMSSARRSGECSKDEISSRRSRDYNMDEISSARAHRSGDLSLDHISSRRRSRDCSRDRSNQRSANQDTYRDTEADIISRLTEKVQDKELLVKVLEAVIKEKDCAEAIIKSSQLRKETEFEPIDSD